MAPTKKSLKGFVIAYFLLFVINSSSHAQARIAIVGGINRSTVVQTLNQPNFNDYKKGYSPRIGFHIGFIADFPLTPTSKFYFQPGIEYFNKGRKFSQTTKNGVGDTAVYQTTAMQFLNYIDIPLNLVYKFEFAKKMSFIIGLGPYLSFFYSGKTNATTLGPNNYYSSTGNITSLPTGNGPGQYATLDYGINALAGVDFGGSFITANFSRGLQNAYQDSTYSGSFNNQVFSITLGVYLGERKKKKTITEPDSTADEDHDGIVDRIDFCPTVPGLKKYNGCPIPDSDCDSVNDEEDKCPTVFGLKRYDGCPIPDSDSDGVNDEEDKCPTAKGLPQYKGCPIPIDETLAADSIRGDTMIYIIYYDPNKIRINVTGIDKLNKIRHLLKENEGLNVKLSGHSDKTSTEKIAREQATSRAVLVRKNLKDDGIPSGRIKLYVWGSTKYVVPRNKKTDQWQNRRVEIAIYQKPVDTSTANNAKIHKNRKTNAKNGQVLVNDNSIDNSTIGAVNSSIVSHNKKNKSTKKGHQSVTNSNSVTAVTNEHSNATSNTNSDTTNNNINDTAESGRLTIRVKGVDSFAVRNKQGVKNNPDSTTTINKPDSSNVSDTANAGKLTIRVKGTDSLAVQNKQGVKNNSGNPTTINKTDSSNVNDTANAGKLTIRVKGADSLAVENKQGVKNNPEGTTVINKTDSSDVNDGANAGKLTIRVKGKDAFAVKNGQRIKNTTTATSTPAKNKTGRANNNTQPTANSLSSNPVKNTHRAVSNAVTVASASTTSSNKNNSSANNSNSTNTAGTNANNGAKNTTATSAKSNQTVNNNTGVNSGDEINNKKVTGAKNDQQSANTTPVDQWTQAQIDSAVASVDESQTISQKPPAQIADTDKVLDCYTIYFDPNQSILNSASFDILDHIRQILKMDSTLYIGISGYSERIGSETSAQKLSQERAYLTRDYMNSYGVTIDRMRVSYWGSKIPVADDNDPYLQWENRRVDICIYVYPK